MKRWSSGVSAFFAASLVVIFVAACGEQDPGAGGLRSASAPLTQGEVLPTGQACTANGAHLKHAFTSCTTCHVCGGVLQFDQNGPAVLPGASAAAGNLPTFDATQKTCTNVACHSVKPGTFSYYFPGGDGEPVLNTVSYGGAPRPTPSWYATGAVGCTTCHDDPPRNGSTGSNVWHSGFHGGQGPTGAYNQCQFCHPDASSPGNGIGDTIVTANASMHANGAINVQATFTSACFSCH
jgi:hypothetical protein